MQSTPTTKLLLGLDEEQQKTFSLLQDLSSYFRDDVTRWFVVAVTSCIAISVILAIEFNSDPTTVKLSRSIPTVVSASALIITLIVSICSGMQSWNRPAFILDRCDDINPLYRIEAETQERLTRSHESMDAYGPLDQVF